MRVFQATISRQLLPEINWTKPVEVHTMLWARLAGFPAWQLIQLEQCIQGFHGQDTFLDLLQPADADGASPSARAFGHRLISVEDSSMTDVLSIVQQWQKHAQAVEKPEVLASGQQKVQELLDFIKRNSKPEQRDDKIIFNQINFSQDQAEWKELFAGWQLSADLDRKEMTKEEFALEVILDILSSTDIDYRFSAGPGERLIEKLQKWKDKYKIKWMEFRRKMDLRNMFDSLLGAAAIAPQELSVKGNNSATVESSDSEVSDPLGQDSAEAAAAAKAAEEVAAAADSAEEAAAAKAAEEVSLANPYQRYRLQPIKVRKGDFVQLCSVSFRGPDQQVLTPSKASTSGTSPPDEGPENALDQSNSTKWLSYDMGSLEVEFAEPVTVHSYCWKTANDGPERDMVCWEFSGWDGQGWVELHEQKSDFDTSRDRFAMLPWFTVVSQELSVKGNNSATVESSDSEVSDPLGAWHRLTSTRNTNSREGIESCFKEFDDDQTGKVYRTLMHCTLTPCRLSVA